MYIYSFITKISCSLPSFVKEVILCFHTFKNILMSLKFRHVLL